MKNKKILRLIVIVFIILLIAILSLVILKMNEKKEVSLDTVDSIKEIVEFYDCKYISEKVDYNKYFILEVEMEFCKNLYDGDESNESFFNDIIKSIARFSGYINFKLLDEKNDITIEVICKDKKIDVIIINNIEDYFKVTDSNISLKKYKEIATTSINVNSNLLSNLVDSDWSKDINFGTKDSTYNGYNIYFDEGVKVRVVNGKVYNIIFTSNYKDYVVGNISPSMSKLTIEQNLGTPTFKNDELGIYGYKSDKFYVFFGEDFISIYKNEKENYTEFWNLINELLNEEKDFLSMMNELTYLWPDYDVYDYTSSSVFLSYPLKGVEIKVNYDNTTGIILYNNCSDSLDIVEKYLNNQDFIGKLQEDACFTSEQRRVKNYNELISKASENESQSSLYNIYIELQEKYITGVKFIPINSSVVERELNDTIQSYAWINDSLFVFSKSQKGIYTYNLNTGHVEKIISGDEEYNDLSFQNGILKYDDKEVILNY